MPLNIVTDTDVAAVPFAANPAYSFSIDPKNKGPFAGMLPLSHVLDPAREKECIDRLAGQFKAIPYNDVREIFLLTKSPQYILNSMSAAYNHDARNKAAEMLLNDKFNITETAADPLAAAIGRQASKRNAKSLPALMETYAREANVPLAEAPQHFLESLRFSELDQAGRQSLKAAYDVHFTSPAVVAAGEAAKNSQARVFAECFDEATRKPLLEAMERSIGDKGMGQATADVLYKAFDTSTPAQKEKLIGSIEQAVAHHKLQPPQPSIGQMIGQIQNGKGLSFTLEELKAAQAIAASPAQAAAKHYQALKAAAQAGAHVPKVKVAQYEPAIESLLTHCPPAVRNAAEAGHIKMVIAGDGVRIDDIVPNPGGLQFFSETKGGSTGHGIYISAPLLQQPEVLKEEILHEVEGHIGGIKGRFSTQAPWKKAIALDTVQGAQNPVFQHLTQHPIQLSDNVSKANAAIGFGKKPLNLANSGPMEFIEAVPDLYHYQAWAEKELAKKGKIVIGGMKYTTADQVMAAAFPNAWPMLEGTGEGMKLIQHASGNVEQIIHAVEVPAGAEAVMSLRGHCELHTGIKSPPRAIVVPEQSVGTFLRNAEGKIKFGKVGGIVTGVVVVGGGLLYLFNKKKQGEASGEKQSWTKRTSESAPQQRSL